MPARDYQNKDFRRVFAETLRDPYGLNQGKKQRPDVWTWMKRVLYLGTAILIIFAFYKLISVIMDKLF